MNTFRKFIKPTLVAFIMFSVTVPAQGQFLKKLGKAAERAAKRTVENRVEQETSKKTDAALDSILEPGSKRNEKIPSSQQDTTETNTDKEQDRQSIDNNSETATEASPKNLAVYSKFDFVPGDKQLFFDDFSDEFVGDFPSQWNTNGNGEIVVFEDGSGKWFEINDGQSTFYIADLDDLPEDYTIEFDLETLGMDSQTSSAATLAIILDDSNAFKWGANSSYIYLPFAQYSARGIRIWNRIDDETTINNTVDADVRKEMSQRPHISIAVNKQRLRLFINEKKHIDVPRMIKSGAPLKSLKFQVNGTKEGKERIFIKNIKVAEGGVDLRRTLISKGKISTNGILFDSGSANIQPQSMGIIRQIYQVLQQESTMKLKIVGHTDADGSEDTNLKLSKLRAEAVKKVLTDVYEIGTDRLYADGKGATTPIGDNATADGKAQNRRVEFIKQ